MKSLALVRLLTDIEQDFEKAVHGEIVPEDLVGIKEQSALLHRYLTGELHEHSDHDSDDAAGGASSDVGFSDNDESSDKRKSADEI